MRFSAFIQHSAAALLLLAILPAFTLASETDADGTWRIVNYWSEWCAPCRKEIPMLNALHRELASSNIRVVGVNFDEDPRETTLATARRLGIEFYVLTAAEVSALGLRAPDVMPTTYIISPENRPEAKLIGLQSRSHMLEQLSRLGLLPSAP